MSNRLKKLLSYYRPYLGLFISVLLCSFAVAGVALIIPLVVRYVTKDVLEGGLADPIGQIAAAGWLLILLVAVQSACTFWADYRGHLLGAKMESDLREELFAHYQKLSHSFYDEHRIGRLMSRITNDLLSLTELYHHGPEDLIISSVKFIGAFVILLGINAQLTLVVFAFLPIMGFFAFHLNVRMNRALTRNRERIADVNAQVEDTLSGIRVVKSFTNEETEGRKFASENARFLESRRDTYKNEAYFSLGIGAFSQLVTVAVIVFGGISIVNATLDLPDLLVFLMYVGSLIEPIRQLLNVSYWYQEGITAFNRFMEIIEIEPEIKDLPEAVSLDDVRGNIQFRNVGFRYGVDRDFVLKGIDLEIAAGEYAALVGSSGAGKTTFCSLIPRFYEVTEGEILLDGVNIRDITLSSLRRSVGIVQQDVYVFAGTVLENIRYGRPDATDEEVFEAAKRANAHEFITSLPAGYDSDLGPRGVKLSGGQKQRISIARVFLKDPPILILDEATSSLDNLSERVVQESLDRLARDRTTIVIAHRLSTIRNARRIVVLGDNGIEEQGTHSELLTSGGTYARLYELQYRDDDLARDYYVEAPRNGEVLAEGT